MSVMTRRTLSLIEFQNKISESLMFAGRLIPAKRPGPGDHLGPVSVQGPKFQVLTLGSTWDNRVSEHRF